MPTELNAPFEDGLWAVRERGAEPVPQGDAFALPVASYEALNYKALNTADDPLTGLAEGSLALPEVTPLSGRKRVVRGALTPEDDLNPTRRRRLKDDYLISSDVDQRIRVDLLSKNFDAYLQIVDGATGRVLRSRNKGLSGTNARLTFDLEAGRDYIIRATSRDRDETGRYRLRTRFQGSMSAAAPTAPAALATPTASSQFSVSEGYGLIDAAAAVVASTNRATGSAIADAGQSWSSNLINAPEVWASGVTGEGVVVAVVDSGVDFNHLDLDQSIWRNRDEIAGNGIDDDGNGYVDDVRGWDFIGGDNRPMDLNGHGTHVAGTIAAENNGQGITGVAYGAEIMPIRVLDGDGVGSTTAIAYGISYAVDNGADVINLSLGGDTYTPDIDAAIRYATQQGAIVVSAAGNSGLAQPGFPAQFATESGLSVGAVDRNQRLADFSNRAGANAQLRHVVAPGVDIVSTVPGGGYAALSGTSMAAPHVSGAVALMLSANPNLTHAQVRNIITTTAV
ncbi:MAG: S8 family peptidase [Elainellaceae cyanobacterium]